MHTKDEPQIVTIASRRTRNSDIPEEARAEVNGSKGLRGTERNRSPSETGTSPRSWQLFRYVADEEAASFHLQIRP